MNKRNYIIQGMVIIYLIGCVMCANNADKDDRPWLKPECLPRLAYLSSFISNNLPVPHVQRYLHIVAIASAITIPQQQSRASIDPLTHCTKYLHFLGVERVSAQQLLHCILQHNNIYSNTTTDTARTAHGWLVAFIYTVTKTSRAGLKKAAKVSFRTIQTDLHLVIGAPKRKKAGHPSPRLEVEYCNEYYCQMISAAASSVLRFSTNVQFRSRCFNLMGVILPNNFSLVEKRGQPYIHSHLRRGETGGRMDWATGFLVDIPVDSTTLAGEQLEKRLLASITCKVTPPEDSQVSKIGYPSQNFASMNQDSEMDKDENKFASDPTTENNIQLFYYLLLLTFIVYYMSITKIASFLMFIAISSRLDERKGCMGTGKHLDEASAEGDIPFSADHELLSSIPPLLITSVHFSLSFPTITLQNILCRANNVNLQLYKNNHANDSTCENLLSTQNGSSSSLPCPGWMMFLNDSDILEEVFEQVYVPFNCLFLVVHVEGSTLLLTEVYHVYQNGPLHTFPYGNWSLESGLNTSPLKSLYKRRRHLHGLVIKGTSIDRPPITNVKYERKWKHRIYHCTSYKIFYLNN
uniref:(California timema) hypothetical protein n=1 Tax=Timema californicum TaxID=61474 RepID=A0A7R9IUY3_TIMCA|nr:unnamed protein product [Timema californicum]